MAAPRTGFRSACAGLEERRRDTGELDPSTRTADRRVTRRALQSLAIVVVLAVLVLAVSFVVAGPVDRGSVSHSASWAFGSFLDHVDCDQEAEAVDTSIWTCFFPMPQGSDGVRSATAQYDEPAA